MGVELLARPPGIDDVDGEPKGVPPLEAADTSVEVRVGAGGMGDGAEDVGAVVVVVVPPISRARRLALISSAAGVGVEGVGEAVWFGSAIAMGDSGGGTSEGFGFDGVF